MTFDELWEVYRKRNPALRKPSGNVTMTVDNLRRLAKQAYDQGRKACKDGIWDDPEREDPLAFVKDILSGRQT